MMRAVSRIHIWYEALRLFGLGLPEAVEEAPWGHCALKVRGKTFLFLDEAEAELSLSVKLPVSRDFALVFDFAEPTGYGLGRSGWITARFREEEAPDLDLMKRWIAESYRTIAPKKLGALVPAVE
jgi:predicted DNA-binding protein (MmcQ/YjbR family)